MKTRGKGFGVELSQANANKSHSKYYLGSVAVAVYTHALIREASSLFVSTCILGDNLYLGRSKRI